MRKLALLFFFSNGHVQVREVTVTGSLLSFILEWIVAHLWKPVSVRLFLTTVKSFSGKELIVKRSTKQNFFQPSVGHGNGLKRPFS